MWGVGGYNANRGGEQTVQCARLCSFVKQLLHLFTSSPKRVVSRTTIAGNMIFHYTLCKQCNLSVVSINMIDCGLSRGKSDT